MKKLGTGTILSALMASLTLAGCGMYGSSPPPQQAPGLYRGVYMETRSGNLNANVGLPVDWSMRARCVGGSWNLSRVAIVTGALPPGLRIDPSSMNIVGVPTRAGTWHLRLRYTGVTCAGKSYKGNTQDLHITTKGSSAPRRIP